MRLTTGRARGTLLTLVVLAAGVACTGQGQDDVDTGSVDPSPPPSLSAETEAETETEVDIVWQRAEVQGVAPPATTSDFAELLPGRQGRSWLAVGAAIDAERRTIATVWRSPDALTWSEGERLEEGRSSIAAAARSGQLTVLGGIVEQQGREVAALWTAQGEEPFTRVALPEADGQVDEEVLLLSSGPVGVVALGARGAGEERAARLWFSSDAAEFTLHDVADVFPRDSVLAASGQRAGQAIVAGSVGQGLQQRATVWLSADGVAWEPAQSLGSDSPNPTAVTDVVLAGLRWVAVGWELVDSRYAARVWESPDGRVWSSAPADAGLALPSGGLGVVPTAVETRSDGGLAMVGYSGLENLLWMSDDGITWQQDPLPEQMASSASVGLDLLAVEGSTILMGEGSGGNPVLFRKEGEGPFQEPTATTEVFGARRSWSIASAVVADPEGGFLAVGSRYQPGRAVSAEAGTGVVLESDDGRVWRETSAGGALDRLRLKAVAALGGQIVSVGDRFLSLKRVGEPDAGAVRRAEDGLWQAARPEAFANAESEQGLESLAAGEGLLVSSGTEGVGGRDEMVVRITTDGETWERLPAEPNGFGPREGEQYNGRTTICSGPAGYVAFHSISRGNELDTGVWLSGDGRSWERLAPVMPLGSGLRREVRSCTATDDGYLVTGLVETEDDGPDGFLWSSTDGRSWAPVDVPGLTGPGTQFVNAVAVNGQSRLLAGGGDDGVAIWLATEGGAFEPLPLDQEIFGGDLDATLEGAVIEDGRAVLVGGRGDAVGFWRADLTP